MMAMVVVRIPPPTELGLQPINISKEKTINVVVWKLPKSWIEPVADQQWDLIVSNPPYISAEEWPLMDISVREKEPKMALFAQEQGLAITEQWCLSTFES